MFFDLTRLEMSYHPAYAYALSFKSLKENILVDIGSCCMPYNSSYRVCAAYICIVGTDLRKLVRDGYPPDRVIGFDVRSSKNALQCFTETCLILIHRLLGPGPPSVQVNSQRIPCQVRGRQRLRSGDV